MNGMLNNSEKPALDPGLLEEYRQLCDDWRLRDRYVLETFTGATVIFGLIVFVFKDLDSGQWGLQLGLLGLGALFSWIVSISVVKYIQYRDASAALLRRISDKLGINKSIADLRKEPSIKDDGLGDLWKDAEGKKAMTFFRKIPVEQKFTSLKCKSDPSDQLLNDDWLDRKMAWLASQGAKRLWSRHTFHWMLFFYITACVVFVGCFLAVLIEHVT